MAEYDVDKVLVIDNELRTIAIPEDLLLGVESDEAVQKLIFDMPRYYNGIDLSVFAIRVNYMNANNEGDVYIVESPTIDTERITFTWVVGRQATKYKGDTHFVVCLKKLRQDSTIEKEFNTTVHALPVLVGLETTQTIIEEHPDIFEQLLVNLTVQTAQAVQQITTTGQQYVSQAAASAQTATEKASEAAGSATAARADAIRAEAAAESVEVYADGTYDGMTVGDAKQLITDRVATDKGIYLFRRSGGDLNTEVNNREYVKSIVGGTVVWNQQTNSQNIGGKAAFRATISREGNYATFTENRTTANATFGGATSLANNTIPSGHVTLISANVTAISMLNFNRIEFGLRSLDAAFARAISATAVGLHFGIVKQTNFDAVDVAIFAYTNTKTGTTDTFTLGELQAIDLTQMFGSTIADYIYSLEQATEGAGVAFFRSLFPKPYYAYNAGELMSVQTSAHKMVGFNQWAEEWEIGYYSTTDGTSKVTTSSIRSKATSPISVLPSTAYYYKFPSTTGLYTYYYDATDTFISYASISSERAATTPSNCAYVRFGLEAGYGTTYNNDICINLSNSVLNGQYQPYEELTYPLDPVELRGMFKLDDSNKFYCDGDIYKADGSVTRKYGIVDMGTLAWTKDTSYGFNRFKTTLPKVQTIESGLVCVPYTQTFIPSGNQQPDKSIKGATGENTFFVRDESFAAYSGQQFKAAMSGVYLVYELSTPTTETARHYAQSQVVNKLGTEEFVDYGVLGGTRDVAIPVGHITEYPEDLVGKLKDLPDQVLNLYPTDTASGSIASFPDGADGVAVESLIAQIEPVQTGSGDPSPDNVRPIRGWTGANVPVTGINVWDEEWEVGTLNASGQNTPDNTKIRSTNYIAVKVGQTYYVKSPEYLIFCEYDQDKTFIRTNAGIKDSTYTVPEGVFYVRWRTGNNYGATYNNDISINYPSTDADYHAYNGAVYPISWESEAGTVYGGELNVTTGVLTVTWGGKDMGTLTWTYEASPNRFKTEGFVGEIKPPTAATVAVNAISSLYKPVPSSSLSDGSFASGTTGNVFVKDTRYTVAADFKAAVAGQTIVYELATPVTYRLASVADIKTLLGDNNIWADTGDVEVVYRADTKLYINKKLAELQELIQ